MNMNTVITRTLLAALAVASAAGAQVMGEARRSVNGVGAAALGMGGAYAAISDDASGLFWNPAGVAFATSGAVTIGLDGIAPEAEARLGAAADSPVSTARNQRLHLHTVSALWRGERCGRGRAFGVSYASPYALDAVLDYRGRVTGDSGEVAFRNQYLSLGTLDFWTVGGGVQIARGLAIGGAVSAVSGAQRAELRYYEDNDAASERLLYHDYLRRRYAGYDARIGIAYRGERGMSIGARMTLPSRIAFVEYGEMRGSGGENADYQLNGHLRSPLHGAAGLAIRLPALTISAEARGEAPRPRRRLDDTARRWKTGAALGIEAAPAGETALLRAGYEWSRFNRTPYEIHYADPVETAAAPSTTSPTGEHRLSAGAGLRFSKRIRLDCAYSLTWYSLETAGALYEKHREQRLTGSFGIAF
jgi:hypothetical protein